MVDTFEDYLKAVDSVESPESLGPWAKRSLEPFESSRSFLGGNDIRQYYQEQVSKNPSRMNLRTPLQRERDRIVHSLPLRNLAEKFHVLYYKDQKISRNYITHAMRMAQIARALCRGLKLNQDFAEAIALGSKVGSIPFKHVSNTKIPEWAEAKIAEIARVQQHDLSLAPTDVDFPPWITKCAQEEQKKIKQSIPVARLKNDVDRSYSAGKQGYLMLMTNPYLFEDTPGEWQKETAYGIWRHSLNKGRSPENTFRFSYRWSTAKSEHELTWENDTYESMVVRLADDITWVIENLQDANYARVLSSRGHEDLFTDIHSENQVRLEDDFLNALANRNVGEIYNLFIRDCVETTRAVFQQTDQKHKDWLEQRNALRAGDIDVPMVCLSEKGYRTLDRFKEILDQQVFGDPRTQNRNKVLGTILDFVANQLFGSWPDTLPENTREWVHQRASRYPRFGADGIISRANKDSYYRIQLVINIMSEISDSDIFQMVGMGTI